MSYLLTAILHPHDDEKLFCVKKTFSGRSFTYNLHAYQHFTFFPRKNKHFFLFNIRDNHYDLLFFN